jgi:hypothetical protein
MYFYKLKLTRPKYLKKLQILMNLFHTFDKKKSGKREICTDMHFQNDVISFKIC